MESAHSRDLRGCRHLRRTISVDRSSGLGAIPPARASSKEDYVAPPYPVGQGLDRIHDYICDNRSDSLSCKALGLLRAPNNRGDRMTAGAQTLRDAVPNTARGSNYEDFHFSSPDVTALAYVRGNAIGFFTSTSWSIAGIEAARHYVRAAVNTSRERTY
jgi:hypothetical protein